MNTQLLEFIIERITGNNFEDAVIALMWITLAMENDGGYAMSTHDEQFTGGFFGSRLRD